CTRKEILEYILHPSLRSPDFALLMQSGFELHHASMTRLFIIVLVFACHTSVCQTSQYKALIDSVINVKGRMFVASQVTRRIRLEKSDIRDNYEDLKEELKFVDTFVLFQIVENSKMIDTASWTDDDLDKVILIQNREQDIQLNHVIQKLHVTDKKEI